MKRSESRFGGRAAPSHQLDGDTRELSNPDMTNVTSRMLHEKTGQLLDWARQGERFRILRDGPPDAFLIPAREEIDPQWSEIMADVWAAQRKPLPKQRKSSAGGETKKEVCGSFTLTRRAYSRSFTRATSFLRCSWLRH
jgi:antitoxin (DNA-binding transcriptional repressor) of toxin-antitoxin stability system